MKRLDIVRKDVENVELEIAEVIKKPTEDFTPD
jgi:hypothetical protein